MGDAAAAAAAVIPAGGGGAAPAPAAIPAVGGGAAAQPAAAAPTAEELELQSYGAPADISQRLVGKFLELARSKPPTIVVDEEWGAKFAHPAGVSQFARYGWCARPVIRDGHLLVRCILAKSSGDGLCGKTTQLSRVVGGRTEVKFHNHLEHLQRQHKRFLLEPSVISGALTAEPDIEVKEGGGAKRGRVGAGGASDEVDKIDVEDYKDALLKMALADGRPLSLGDSVGFRQRPPWATTRSRRWRTARGWGATATAVAVVVPPPPPPRRVVMAFLSLTAEGGGKGGRDEGLGAGEWTGCYFFVPCDRKARACAQGGGPYFLRYPRIPPLRCHVTPHYPRERPLPLPPIIPLSPSPPSLDRTWTKGRFCRYPYPWVDFLVIILSRIIRIG